MKTIFKLSRIGLMFIFSALIVSAPRHVQAEGQDNRTLPQWIEGAEYVGTETCAACHEKQNEEFRLSTHARIEVKDAEGEAQGCEICHGPGSLHAENDGDKSLIINPRNKPEICFTCHMDKKVQFRLPYHHPVLEGHMSCADCHNLHGPEVRPWTSTSMKDVNEACFKCHQDKQGPYPFEHGALREGCTVCHDVHGSITDKMLVARDANLCLRCHIQSDFPTIGNRNHSSNLNESTCWSAGCHTAVHGSYFDRHFRE